MTNCNTGFPIGKPVIWNFNGKKFRPICKMTLKKYGGGSIILEIFGGGACHTAKEQWRTQFLY